MAGELWRLARTRSSLDYRSGEYKEGARRRPLCHDLLVVLCGYLGRGAALSGYVLVVVRAVHRARPFDVAIGVRLRGERQHDAASLVRSGQYDGTCLFGASHRGEVLSLHGRLVDAVAGLRAVDVTAVI